MPIFDHFGNSPVLQARQGMEHPGPRARFLQRFFFPVWAWSLSLHCLCSHSSDILHSPLISSSNCDLMVGTVYICVEIYVLRMLYAIMSPWRRLLLSYVAWPFQSASRILLKCGNFALKLWAVVVAVLQTRTTRASHLMRRDKVIKSMNFGRIIGYLFSSRIPWPDAIARRSIKTGWSQQRGKSNTYDGWSWKRGKRAKSVLQYFTS